MNGASLPTHHGLDPDQELLLDEWHVTLTCSAEVSASDTAELQRLLEHGLTELLARMRGRLEPAPHVHLRLTR